MDETVNAIRGHFFRSKKIFDLAISRDQAVLQYYNPLYDNWMEIYIYIYIYIYGVAFLEHRFTLRSYVTGLQILKNISLRRGKCFWKNIYPSNRREIRGNGSSFVKGSRAKWDRSRSKAVFSYRIVKIWSSNKTSSEN